MKSEYFNKRSQSTQLRGHREKPKPKKVNWDRIVYFVLLVLILGMLSYYLFMNTFYVSGEGLVVTETVKVRAPEDIEIQEQLVSRNGFVEQGEPLFHYRLMDWTGDASQEIENLQDNIVDEQEEIDEIQDDITLQRQSIQEIEGRISYLEEQREDFLERIRLNAATSFEVQEVENSLFTARSNLREAQAELNVLINNLNRHIQSRENLQANVEEFQTGENRVQTFYSPVSGRIYNISVNDNQQAFRTDQIVAIKPDQADVYIFSVFEREDAEYVQPGTVMNIEFDNGQESEGVIRSSYDARENLIDHFEQTGSLTTEYIVVEVVPLDSTARSQWLELDRSGLQIFRKKVGRDEANIPDQTASRANSEIGSAERNVVESNNQTESVSDSIQQSSESEMASAIQEPADNHPAYGLMGNSLHDQLAGYSINLYTFKDRDKATTAQENMKKEGYRVGVQPVTIDGEELWRVFVGQFETEEDAQAAAESLPAAIADNYFINRMP